MKKRAVRIAAVGFGCACILAGCSGKNVTEKTAQQGAASEQVTETKDTERTETKAETEALETEIAETEAGESKEPETEETAAEEKDALPVWTDYSSELGYSLQYDAAAFTLEETGEQNCFTYIKEETAVPVYLTIMKYQDVDIQTAADEIVQQFGNDEINVQDMYMGVDSMAVKYVYIESEANGVKQIQIFYAVPSGEDSLLIEACSYVDAPETVDAGFEHMLGTFSCTADAEQN